MKKLIEILEELQPEVDYETTENLIDGRYLDSLTILSLVSEIIPANFNSAKKIWELIERLKEE